jgi:hypothetical protein
MHLLFSGMMHSAETAPMEGEIFSDKDLRFHCPKFSHKTKQDGQLRQL